MGKSKKSVKLFVEFDGLKLVYIAKGSMIVGKMLKKLEKRFKDTFDLDTDPVFEKVFENGYLISLYDSVGDLFNETAELELHSSKHFTKPFPSYTQSSEKFQKIVKKDQSKEKDFKQREKFPEQSPAEKLKQPEKDQKSLQIPSKKPEENKKEDQKREDTKKDEKKSENSKKEDQPKDPKQESGNKKPKRPEIKEPIVKFIKQDDDRKAISNDSSKKDPLKTSSSSESDSDIFTKEEKKPMLSKSNIFRN